MKIREIAASFMLCASVASCFSRTAFSAPIVYADLSADLTSGSLAGTQFPVSFSYDAAQVSPTGQSYILLNSFDFTLDGVVFSKPYIFQGGQAIFQDGQLDNVTASFQVTLPPGTPVENITFGFGGPGIIGYTDLAGQDGSGVFTFTPEPSSVLLAAAVFSALAFWNQRHLRRV